MMTRRQSRAAPTVPPAPRPQKRACSELKSYFLLDFSDAWELGPKLVFRGSDPPLVFVTCVFLLAL